jgi:4-amino-4-deoxy-L-arabinose transferase-like glycosyltransferase
MAFVSVRAEPATPLMPSWLPPLVLALPFLIMIAVLRGMTVALPIFHGSDELSYHYPTILQFSRELPFPNLHRYPAAQTPLYHLLLAYLGKLIGYRLWTLRLVQVLISYGLVLAVFRLLARRLAMAPRQALALTLLFALSPYVFGQAFRLGTDNLAMLFTVLAIERFERFREANDLAAFLVGCAWTGLAMVTRQSTSFLVAVAVLYALLQRSKLSRTQLAVAACALVLCALPVSLLFLNWHGLIPVGSDPSSCGLCSAKGAGNGLSLAGLEVPTMELALATVGLYGAVLFAPATMFSLRTSLRVGGVRRWLQRVGRGPLVAACAGVALLLVFPATPGAQAAGDFWKVAGHLPSIDGSSLLFWVLVPLSGVVLWERVGASPRPTLVVIVASCFLVSAVAIHEPWQKYVDPPAILILLLTLGLHELDKAWKWAGAAALVLAFLAYTADYSSHRSVPHRRAPVAETGVGGRGHTEGSTRQGRKPEIPIGFWYI